MPPTFQHRKQLGQHFLIDPAIAQRIVNSLTAQHTPVIIEIGPGQGALTQWLVPKCQQGGHVKHLYLVEKDPRLIPHLRAKYQGPNITVLHNDFLQWYIPPNLTDQLAIIGNLPYNIASQILFRLLEGRTQVQEVVCMVQEEVARRIAAAPGNKQYGIMSVLLQAFYNVDYLVTIPPTAFQPRPQVVSGVIRLTRHRTTLPCPTQPFMAIVKAGFQQRRKQLKNALCALNVPLRNLPQTLGQQRAEALAVQDFLHVTNTLFPEQHNA